MAWLRVAWMVVRVWLLSRTRRGRQWLAQEANVLAAVVRDYQRELVGFRRSLTPPPVTGCVVRDCQHPATSVPTLIVRHAPGSAYAEVTLNIPLCADHAPALSLAAVFGIADWPNIETRYERMHGATPKKRWCSLRMDPLDSATPLKLSDHISKTPGVAVESDAGAVVDAVTVGVPHAHCVTCGAVYVATHGFPDRCSYCQCSRTERLEVTA